MFLNLLFAWLLVALDFRTVFAHGLNALDLRDLKMPPARRFSPATLSSALGGRSIGSSILKREASFDFVESSHNAATAVARSIDDSVFSTSIRARSQRPILAVEDLEPHLERVSCSESAMELLFVSVERFEQACHELENVSSFVAVTSHFGCNKEDERAPHLISKVVIDPKKKTITLSKTGCSWNEAFSSTEVSWSRKPSHHVVRRQLADPEQSPASSTELIPSPTNRFPIAPSPATSLPAHSTDGLDMQIIDKVVMPPQNPIADLFIPQGVTLSCTNCTLQGDIDISKGSFEFEEVGGIDALAEIANNTIQFFQHGTIEVDVDGIFAHIELNTEFDLSQGGLNFTVPLPQIPLTPFAIPGIVAFGVVVAPEITMALTLDSKFDFSYGFNVSVPKGSGFSIDVNNLSNSTMRGFDKATLQALPFQASTPVTSLVFQVSFTPQILLGVSTATGSTVGGIGAFFNLPSLSVNMTQLDNVNYTCDPLPEKSEDEKKKADDDDNKGITLNDFVGNFTNIVPSVEFNVGAFAELEVGLANFQMLATEVTVASTVFNLPTACVSFNKEDKKFQEAEVVVASAVASATASSAPGDGSVKGKEREKSAATRVGGAGLELGLIPWIYGVLGLLALILGL
ncbi:hypothetical protein AJ80_00152 [Polytolypa hystricis UAMH7299]|uniref:GPI anchored protein n=1 Tax=Polytolypa hystricis (strain UAMH7299) TaxID=1447883 RepID=A0A2B7Z4G9_POLH7|nr:hypothetical protein AJ80_00152 [Polytolypa hystricis UAMH7299]